MTEPKNHASKQHGAHDAPPHSFWLRPYHDIVLALGLLTTIPMPHLNNAHNIPLARAAWAFPIAGTLIGVIGALAYILARTLALDLPVAILVALVAMLLTSGALHEDGLADFLDGLGGGNTPQARLEIMHDSRIGTYGALALGLTLTAQGLLLVSLAQPNAPWPLWSLIITVSAIARAAILLPMGLLSPARETGLGKNVSKAPKGELLLGIALAAALAIALLGLTPALFAITGAFAMSVLITALAHRYLCGQTGDVLGAAASMSTVGALLALKIGAVTLYPLTGAHP